MCHNTDIGIYEVIINKRMQLKAMWMVCVI